MNDSMTQGNDILIVDDDVVLCNLLERYLSRQGYQVKTATDGEEMHRRLMQQHPDLVILDLNLPDVHGLELARELRKSSDMGIIILTGNNDEVDKVVGLEIGADDYISKPFNERELLARVRSVLRRIGPDIEKNANGEKSKARFADWILDMVAHELIDSRGRNVELTSYEFQLLNTFVTHANRVLSRDQIMENIAGRDWNPSDRSVDVLVGKLRKKIEGDPQNPSLIKTVRGAGYKFTVQVTYH